MPALSSKTLRNLPPEVARPSYDRSQVKPGIAHIGVGAFHRAHQAMYVDRLLEGGAARDWGICGIGLLPADARMRDMLAAQDGLYTLVLKHADGRRERRVIGSLVDYLFAPDDPEAVVEKLASPAIRIVSLTVTEGGYNFSPTTGQFDADNAAVQSDLKPGAMPRTVFGFVVEALARRRRRGIVPFTVMSCDNVQGNGEVARRMFSAFAALRDPELGVWVSDSVAFPNTMVDRITPVTAPQDITENNDALGLADGCPVVAEPFEQWVVEDHFGSGRPDFDQAGAQFVADVHPYELMKLRLLNASHQGLCYFGTLCGYTYAHEATADAHIARLLRLYMDEEATPTLAPVPGIDLEAYKSTLIQRFGNPQVRDTLARLCADSSNRIPKWLLPVVFEQLDAGRGVALSAAIVASWARYARGVDEQGRALKVIDADREAVMAAAARERTQPGAFLSESRLFGDLAQRPAFVEPYLRALRLLDDVGARGALDEIVSL